MHTSYVFTVPMKEKSAENNVQAYPTGIFTHKGGDITILSDNGMEFKNTALNNANEQLGIKDINLFLPLGNSRIENMQNFLKRTLSF